MRDLLLGYTGVTIDRAAARRCDPKWLEVCLRDAKTRIIRFEGSRPRIRLSDNPRATIAYECLEAAAGKLDQAVFLGVDVTGAAVFAVNSGEPQEEGTEDGVKLIDLRSLAVQGLLDAGELNLLAQARTLLDWHERHRFCAACGAPTEPLDGGYRRHCPSCRANHFPRTDPVVIAVIMNGTRLLLGRQPQFLPGVYSALAGFVEPGESLEEAARREIEEETGIKVGRLIYHSSQPWPFPSNLMIGLLGEAESEAITIDPSELEHARWFPRGEVLQMLEGWHPDDLKVPPPMAIAHHLIRAAVSGQGIG
jgi:NAD+ diphosphatase